MFPPEGPKPILGKEAWQDEYDTCKAWNRPARIHHTDAPFYPWAPNNFRVSFKLGFQ